MTKTRDERHLKIVRSFPCFHCLTEQNIEAHHLLKLPEGMSDEESGTGQKNGDNWTIPLCRRCHGDLHRAGSEIKFFGEAMALQVIKTAINLWEFTAINK